MLVLFLKGDWELMNLSALMDKVIAPLGLHTFVLKTKYDLRSGRFSFLLKIGYQREWGIIFRLYLLLLFLFNCSQLEEEQRKHNTKQGTVKAGAEKVKRGTVQVVISGHQSRLPIPFSLGEASLPRPNPGSVVTLQTENVLGSSCRRSLLPGSVYSHLIWSSCLCIWEEIDHPFLCWTYGLDYPRKEICADCLLWMQTNRGRC